MASPDARPHTPPPAIKEMTMNENKFLTLLMGGIGMKELTIHSGIEDPFTIPPFCPLEDAKEEGC